MGRELKMGTRLVGRLKSDLDHKDRQIESLSALSSALAVESDLRGQ